MKYRFLRKLEKSKTKENEEIGKASMEEGSGKRSRRTSCTAECKRSAQLQVPRSPAAQL